MSLKTHKQCIFHGSARAITYTPRRLLQEHSASQGVESPAHIQGRALWLGFQGPLHTHALTGMCV